MNKRIITLGEIMLRLSTPGYERFINTRSYEVVYGGAEANVAISLANWGESAAHVTVFPNNDIGKAATNTLPSSSSMKDAWEYISWKMAPCNALQKSSMIALIQPSLI